MMDFGEIKIQIKREGGGVFEPTPQSNSMGETAARCRSGPVSAATFVAARTITELSGTTGVVMAAIPSRNFPTTI